MADKIIDYYLALTSPWSYLGGPRLQHLARKHGAIIHVRPIDFAEVLPAGGGVPLPQRAPARQAYRLIELARWRDFLNMPLNLKPKFFPVPDKLAAGMVIAAGDEGGKAIELSQAILTAIWAEEKDISNAETLAAIADKTGLDGKSLLAKAETPAILDRRAAYTKAAIDKGVFGLPTYVYRDEIFWGQDRLDFLDRALGV